MFPLTERAITAEYLAKITLLRDFNRVKLAENSFIPLRRNKRSEEFMPIDMSGIKLDGNTLYVCGEKSKVNPEFIKPLLDIWTNLADHILRPIYKEDLTQDQIDNRTPIRDLGRLGTLFKLARVYENGKVGVIFQEDFFTEWPFGKITADDQLEGQVLPMFYFNDVATTFLLEYGEEVSGTGTFNISNAKITNHNLLTSRYIFSHLGSNRLRNESHRHPSDLQTESCVHVASNHPRGQNYRGGILHFRMAFIDSGI